MFTLWQRRHMHPLIINECLLCVVFLQFSNWDSKNFYHHMSVCFWSNNQLSLFNIFSLITQSDTRSHITDNLISFEHTNVANINTHTKTLSSWANKVSRNDFNLHIRWEMGMYKYHICTVSLASGKVSSGRM